MQELKRLEARVIRIEKLLVEALAKMKPDLTERIPEKQVIAQYGVSRHVLRRLRLGYKRSDGLDIPPVIKSWRHVNGRNFDYDKAELDRVLRQSVI
jgi:hypothetical protein